MVDAATEVCNPSDESYDIASNIQLFSFCYSFTPIKIWSTSLMDLNVRIFTWIFCTKTKNMKKSFTLIDTYDKNWKWNEQIFPSTWML